jgi:hypothetical protein
MRTPITIAVVALFGSALFAQEVKPPKPVVVKLDKQGKVTKQDKTKDGKTQDPKKGSDKKSTDKKGTDNKTTKKQDPKKKAPPYREKTKEEIEEENGPLPGGTDPEDLRAMKGAQDMLRAEKKLAAMLKAGKIKGIDQVLPFEEIASWPYEDGLKGMPKKLKSLDGKKVMMTGFMLPIDEVENIKEFLLVQSLWSCCYGQPPDINGTVRVVMKGKKRIDYKFEPIKVVGTFRIKSTIEDGFCVDIYQLETTSVEVIK